MAADWETTSRFGELKVLFFQPIRLGERVGISVSNQSARHLLCLSRVGDSFLNRLLVGPAVARPGSHPGL